MKISFETLLKIWLGWLVFCLIAAGVGIWVVYRILVHFGIF